MNHVDIICEKISIPEWLPNVEDFILKVLDSLMLKNWELSLVFTNDERMQELNREYRGKDESTDVLSFELGDTVLEDGIEVFVAGDIVISLDMLKKNAEYFQVSVNEELKRLLIHGILHLNGQEHETNDALEPMLISQERLLLSFSEVVLL